MLHRVGGADFLRGFCHGVGTGRVHAGGVAGNPWMIRCGAFAGALCGGGPRRRLATGRRGLGQGLPGGGGGGGGGWSQGAVPESASRGWRVWSEPSVSGPVRNSLSSNMFQSLLQGRCKKTGGRLLFCLRHVPAPCAKVCIDDRLPSSRSRPALQIWKDLLM